jgi:hypothetical protein
MRDHHAELRKESPYTTPQRGATDRRVERTRRALGAALMELMLERHFDSITVQDVLDRDDRPTPEQMDAIYHELVWRALSVRPMGAGR